LVFGFWHLSFDLQLANATDAHRTPPGFSRWCFNFTAREPSPRTSNTTRLQPVVF
jgi:hypothetical protein